MIIYFFALSFCSVGLCSNTQNEPNSHVYILEKTKTFNPKKIDTIYTIDPSQLATTTTDFSSFDQKTFSQIPIKKVECTQNMFFGEVVYFVIMSMVTLYNADNEPHKTITKGAEKTTNPRPQEINSTDIFGYLAPSLPCLLYYLSRYNDHKLYPIDLDKNDYYPKNLHVNHIISKLSPSAAYSNILFSTENSEKEPTHYQLRMIPFVPNNHSTAIKNKNDESPINH